MTRLRAGRLAGIAGTAAFAAIALAPRAPAAPTSTPAPIAAAPRLPRPPIEVVVPRSILVRPRAAGGAQQVVPVVITGAHRALVLADGTERWDLDADLDAQATVAAKEAIERAHPELEVELDLYRVAHAVPSDEGFPKQWALSLIRAPEAWSVTTGDERLTVAIVDTGYVDHPDLSDRLVPGYDFIVDEANAGDGDGRDADPHDAGDETAASSSFHGAHVTGIVGATTDNGLGMAGVDWRCRIQPVRVLGVKRHRGKDSDIADGIRWAAGLNVPGVPINRTPARIVNLSFGGPGYSRVLQDAVLAAQARGVLVVASAGNEAIDASENVPAALEGVLSVAAAGPDGIQAEYSNFGPRVDLMAPGGALFFEAPTGEETPGAIWSTSYVRSGAQPVFAYHAGTSQAAAYASGVAALVRAAAPSLPPEVVAAVLRRASRSDPEACPAGCGAGLVDAAKAVEYARLIELASCGPEGCGATNELAHVPLRPEEGCAIAAPGRGATGQGAAGALGALVLVSVMAARRRRGRGRRAALAIAPLLCCASACASKAPDREASSQSATAPLVVKIVDPVPTYEDGELVLRVGEGLTITAEVTPIEIVDRVELRIVDADHVIGRLGHAPFAFELPSWVPGPDGKRTVCVTATDARARVGEACFSAIR